MAVAPYLPESISTTLALFLFTLVFFSVAYWLSLSPAKLVDRMGKVLTPTLLVLISLIFIASIFRPIGAYGEATGEYVTSPFVKGFLEGYLTMDTIAALNFGIVISLAIKSRGVSDEKLVVSNSIKAGVIAGSLLIAIYAVLGHLGATSGGRFGTTANGAQTLTNVITYIFGKPGAVLLAVIFTLACLTTCVGLITSCSQYFATLTSKVSYKGFVRILALLSMGIANMGLTQILSISVPVLNAIYPIAIMLIVLGMMNRVFKGNTMAYRLTIIFTGVVSVVDALGQVEVGVEALTKLFERLPLYSQGLGWIVPAVVGMILGVLMNVVKENVKTEKLEVN